MFADRLVGTFTGQALGTPEYSTSYQMARAQTRNRIPETLQEADILVGPHSIPNDKLPDRFQSERTMKNVPAEEDAWWRHFQELLDDQIDFPDDYVFKFIVPARSLNALKNIFGRHPVTVRASSKGRYLSVTAKMEMHSSDEIVALYQAAAKVERVMML